MEFFKFTNYEVIKVMGQILEFITNPLNTRFKTKPPYRYICGGG
jgi:hypothetical protein